MSNALARWKPFRDSVFANLAAGFDEAGGCEGRLSDSALAVGLASLALARGKRSAPALRGFRWLADHQNADGGWGDTTDSPSNLATTLLSLCALHANNAEPVAADRARGWVQQKAGGLDPASIANAVASFYGADRTFSAPILSVCAESGILGPQPQAWRWVMPLPFEAARLPHGFYKWINLPVVSYALPALIAIGLARHRKQPAAFLPLRWLRSASAIPTLTKLQRLQPGSGGFLEAIPLTAFVAINLITAGEQECPVVEACLRFLEQGQRADGGWPIDTHLRTWTTTLAVRALTDHQPAACSKAREYLLQTQQRGIHPFTQAAPGGWGWTHLSGAVPDADDTSAALLALAALQRGGDDPVLSEAVANGLGWLLDLQNHDGGIPTFCRGWANLPFDRSCPDITAHALAAFITWRSGCGPYAKRLTRAIHRAIAYLAHAQRPDGSWVPLWFGNQAAPDQANPVFGTARVVESLAMIDLAGIERLVASGTAWLIRAQNADGGWGGAPGIASSIEETAMAVSALAGRVDCAILDRAIGYLDVRTHHGEQFPASPIGLYFSSLWYSEVMYPLVFTARALGKAVAAGEA